jgi:hypothetical protein
MTTNRMLLVLAFLAAAAPAASWAQQSYCDPRVNAACYQKWCSSIGGKPVYRGNWGCDMSGASRTPTYSGGNAGAELGRQIGGVLGAMLREGLFGNPQQEAERQQAVAAQQQREAEERRRRAEEIARQDEERYQRLKSQLLAFSPPPQLSLMGRESQGEGLQLMLGENAERSLNPGLAELSRAAAWSTLAARAPTPEDAVLLADAAFRTLVGDKVTLPAPPPDVKGLDVHPMFPEVQSLKKEYLAQRAQLPQAWKPALEAMERQHAFMRVESNVREFELRMYQGVRRAPVPREEAERARQAGEEAARLRQQAEDDARRALDAAAKRQYDVNGLEQGLRAWLSSFAAGERKPDSYYYLGFEDGSQCFSQNAGPRCDKARAPKADYDNCLASYRLGYTAGEKIKQALLEDAYQIGQADKDRNPQRNYEDVDTRADGPCRAEYIMSYNNGRLGAALSRVGR